MKIKIIQLVLTMLVLMFIQPASGEVSQGEEMINPIDLKVLVIEPTLNEMVPIWGEGVAKPAAVNLILGTIFQESVIGNESRLKQVGGPALGILQIEPNTHKDIWDNYLAFKPDKASFVRSVARQHTDDLDQELIANIPYAVVIARIKYWRRSFEWPADPNDIQALGKIWDTQYNANPDHGFPEDFLRAFPPGVI